MQNETPQVDPTALNLSRAIRQTEGGDYNNISGDNGTSAGAYQWNNGKLPLQKGEIPANFKSAALRHKLDPNDFSPTNQDHVAYEDIKADLDSGLTQSQIAAKWNSGLTHGWETHKGTTTINGKEISYDTPGYVEKVKKYYEEQSQSGLPASQQTPVEYKPITPLESQPSVDSSQQSSEQKSDTLGGKLSGRIQDASQASSDYTSGKQGLFSSALQGVGALAGAGGDVVGSLIENTPILGSVVKGIESVLGGGVNKFLETDTGKSVASSLRKFAKDNPELSKDIGAGINIVSAIPILKGLGTGVNLVKDAASMALKGVAEKTATTGLEAVVSSTKTGARNLARNPEVVKTLVTERAIPDIVDGKYNTKEAFGKLQEEISNIEDNEYQPLLEKLSKTQGIQTSYVSLGDYEKKAVAKAIEELKDPKPIQDYFKRLKSKYGDYPTIKDMNQAKRIVAKNISESGFNSPNYSTDKIVRNVLQESVEESAKALGSPEINALNQKMSSLIKAQDILQYIDGKSVKNGAIGSVLQTGATAGGAAAGAGLGFSPEVSAYIANKAGGLVGKKLKGIPLGILERTGKGAERTTAKQVYKGAINTTAGLISQKIANPK